MNQRPEVLPDFDLQPDPRVLQMLGEVKLDQWRCIAELVDNCIDGFLAARREGEEIPDPMVNVALPMSDAEGTSISITDNGPGMTSEKLEKAARAGWTGNNPLDSLGLFGMGFNIATARLGAVTTVWTTKKGEAEWHGLRIDLEQFTRQRHFRTSHLTRPKEEIEQHGTEIRIEKLKLEERKFFAKQSNKAKLIKDLSRTYAAMLRPGGVPIEFKLRVNHTQVKGRSHCLWDEHRVVPNSRWGEISPVIHFDRELPTRKFCSQCWVWVPADSATCQNCESGAPFISKQRRVRGWIGLQRYQSVTDFGLDFLRNGRKIELQNKDLFTWQGLEGPEIEYPIDDPRNRGRIVGEIHLDHCRVTYTKDRFDRNDPAWDEMVRIIRGEGPLRPDKARDAGIDPSSNHSPLFRLYQAFRRSSPQSKAAGSWSRILCVPANDRAEEMAKKFHDGEPAYQDDSKWYALVEEQDRKLRRAARSGDTEEEDSDGLPGFGVQGGGSGGGTTPQPPTPQPAQAPISRPPIPSLTQVYVHTGTQQRWSVRAWDSPHNDPELEGAPWRLKSDNAGDFDFYVNTRDAVFKSATLTPLDGLLAELAVSAVDFMRGQPLEEKPKFGKILADLRNQYAATARLDPQKLAMDAVTVLTTIARRIGRTADAADWRALFEELHQSERDAILRAMAIRNVANHTTAIADGRFLSYAPKKALAQFFSSHPEMFLDGKCWDTAFGDLDYESQAATDEARDRIKRNYESLFADAVWLAEQEADDLASAPRQRLLRAALALELLEPDVAGTEDGAS